MPPSFKKFSDLAAVIFGIFTMISTITIMYTTNQEVSLFYLLVLISVMLISVAINSVLSASVNLLVRPMAKLLVFILVPSRYPTQKYKENQLVKQKFPNWSLARIMADKKATRTNKAILFLSCTLLLYLGLEIIGWLDEINWLLATIGIAYLAILIIDNATYTYRIRNDLYGKNREEALEMIRFIKENEDIDWTDRGKPKQVISDEDLRKIQEEISGILVGQPG